MNEQEFLDMVRDHQKLILKVCYLYTSNDVDREDLFQEIVLQLWKSFGTYRGEAKKSSWLYRIALNTAISGLRKRKHQSKQHPLSPELLSIPDSGSDSQTEENIWLKKAIDQLSSVEKALMMLYLEGNSYEEIGEIIGITKNHVGVKINRIKQKLRKMLKPHFS